MVILIYHALKCISQNVPIAFDFDIKVKISRGNVSCNFSLIFYIIHNFLKIIHQIAKFIVMELFKHNICPA